jgi:uncharacterized RDD family membrane protein YckC
VQVSLRLVIRFAMECPHCQRPTSPHAERCNACGGVIPPGQHMLEESGVVEPAVNLPDPDPGQEANTELYRMASLGDRFIAFALDTVFLFGVFAILDAWAFMRWGMVEGWELKLTTASLLMAQFLNGVVLFLYLWLLEAGFGATLGKAIVGIRVVRTVERNPLVALAIRNLMRLVDGFGFYLVGALVAGCSRFRRRLGDICASTVVVEEEFGYAVKILAVLLWAAVLAGAMWSVPHICARNTAKHVRYLDQVVVEVGRTDKSAYFKVAGLRVDVQSASGSGH